MTTSLRDASLTSMLETLRRICETPAPTFEESARGTLVAGLLEEMGLEAVRDEVGNVTAEVPGGSGPRLLLAAHLDTVFDAGTDVRVQERGDRLCAPGIGDNSASLAVTLELLRGLVRPGDDAGDDAGAAYPRVTFAATVGEEGLGDLYGMRRLMRDRASDFDLVVAVDGHLGTLVTAGVGSKRFAVSFRAKGGHSWGDYPSPSAVHALGDAIHALNRLSVPSEPRSSLNVGTVAGGTSVNAIAQDARFLLDIRSLDAAVLGRLESQAQDAVRRVARKHGVMVDVETVGDRPAANVPNAELVAAASEALRSLGIPVRRAASSTDANASLAAGIPSIAFGVYRGGDAHRHSEWLEPASLGEGLLALRALVANVVRLG